MGEIELPEICTGSPPRRPPGSRTAGVGRLAGICFAPGEKLPVCRIFAQNGKWVHIVCGWPARSHKQNRARVCGRAPWRDSRGAAPGTACRAPTNRCGRVSPVALRKMRRATFPGHEDTEAQRRRKGCRAKGRGATFKPEAKPNCATWRDLRGAGPGTACRAPAKAKPYGEKCGPRNDATVRCAGSRVATARTTCNGW
jgi:hypothetical protein